MSDYIDIRDEVIGKIETHLAKWGSSNWQTLFDEYPQVGRRQFYRLISAVKKKKPHTQLLVKAVHEARRAAEKNLPAAPSPNYIMKNGLDARAHLSFMAIFTEVVGDARMLRDYALTRDENGKERIKNPIMFKDSIGLRTDLLETQIKAFREVWELRRMQEMWDTVMDEIGKAAPEVKLAIIERLRAVNDEYGFTIDARV